MRTREDVTGITVIAIDSGTKIGKVEDIIFDFEGNHLLGILLEDSGLSHTGRVVPYSRVRGIGPDAVMVEGEDALMDAEKDEHISRVLGQKIRIKGKEVYTMDGKDLGKITDIQFDEKTGRIEGYEVSGGIFADAYSGRPFIPAPKTIKIGKDVCLVPPEVADVVEKRVGGIRAASQRLSEKVQQVSQAAADRAQELGRQAKGRAQGFRQTAPEKGAGDTDGMLWATKGKMAQKNVVAEDGSLLVTEGVIVDDATIENVKRHHKEQELLEAVR